MEAGTLRLYLIETSSGELQWKQAHLRIGNYQEPIREPVEISITTKQSQTTHSRPVTHSQTRTTIRPPDRLLNESRT